MKKDKWKMRQSNLFASPPIFDRETRCFSAAELRVKRADNEDPKIEGYAAVFNKLSDDLGFFREKIKPGAFTNALKASDVRALFNHDANIVIGRQSAGTLELKEDKKGLFMSATPPDTQAARDLMVSIERGDITQQSFAFSVKEDSWKEGDPEKGEPEIRTIIEVREIFDVSPVVYPAYPDTDVALRSKEHSDAANRANDNDAANRINDDNQEIDELEIQLSTGVNYG